MTVGRKSWTRIINNYYTYIIFLQATFEKCIADMVMN